MRQVLRKVAVAAGFAGGFLLLGAASAGADEPGKGIASGNEAKAVAAVGAPTVQVGASGNAVAVAGTASAKSDGSQHAAPVSNTSSADEAKGSGIASGNDAKVQASGGAPTVQVGACGNAVAVAGNASASCEGRQHASPTASASSDGSDTNGGGIASGNEVLAQASGGAPTVQLNACGNAVAIAGDASASCSGNQTAEPRSASTIAADEDGTEGDGIVSGNEVVGQISLGAPTVQAVACGNAVAVAGDASAACEGTQVAAPVADDVITLDDGSSDGGILSGNVLKVELSAGTPAVQGVVCGNAIAVAGDASASCEGNQIVAPPAGDAVDRAPQGRQAKRPNVGADKPAAGGDRSKLGGGGSVKPPLQPVDGSDRSVGGNDGRPPSEPRKDSSQGNKPRDVTRGGDSRKAAASGSGGGHLFSRGGSLGGAPVLASLPPLRRGGAGSPGALATTGIGLTRLALVLLVLLLVGLAFDRREPVVRR